MKRSECGQFLLADGTETLIYEGEEVWALRRNRDDGTIRPSWHRVSWTDAGLGHVWTHDDRCLSMTCDTDEVLVFDNPTDAAATWYRMEEADNGN